MGVGAKLSKAVVTIARRDRRWLRALARGVAPGVEHLGMLQSIPFESIVDIGANVGQFALAARHVNPNATIFAFEPLTEQAAVFEALFQDDPLTRLYIVAVGSKSAEMDMHVSARPDSSSLLEMTAEQTRVFPGTQQVSRRRVTVCPLTEVDALTPIVKNSLLKIDVQGFELEVLRGVGALLPEFEWVYCECSFVELYAGQALAADVVAWLAAHGFALAGVYNTTVLNGQSVQADLLFTPAHRTPSSESFL